MLSWLCITLYLSLLEMCNLGYKSSFWKWSYRPGFIRAWSPRVILFFLFSPFLSLFFFQDDSLEHGNFIGFLGKPRKIKPLSLPFYFPYHRRHPPEGIPGSCWGWTLAHMDLSKPGEIREAWSAEVHELDTIQRLNSQLVNSPIPIPLAPAQIVGLWSASLP